MTPSTLTFTLLTGVAVLWLPLQSAAWAGDSQWDAQQCLREAESMQNAAGTAEGQAGVLGVLMDRNAEVSRRTLAAITLGTSKNLRWLEPLMSVARDEQEDVTVRSCAIKALADMGAHQAAPLLIELASTGAKKIKWTRQKEVMHGLVRKAALEALGCLQTPEGVELLLSVVSDPAWGQDFKYAAITGLGPVDDPRARSAIAAALTDKDSAMRNTAALAAGKQGSPELLKGLQSTVADGDRFVRLSAAQSLAERKDATGVDTLVEELRADWVCLSAATALRRLGWSPRNEAERVYYLAAEGKWSELRQDWAAARRVLFPDLTSPNRDVRVHAVHLLLALGNEEAVPELRRWLSSSKDDGIALEFLNSGHPELQRAARGWAPRHGMKVKRQKSPSTSGNDFGWGRPAWQDFSAPRVPPESSR